MLDSFESEKTQAADWFRGLRDQIVTEFVAIENRHDSDDPAGQFEVSKTKRSTDDGSDAGGGEMSVMRDGRVFEKVGVNISTVFGTLGERAQNAMAARKGIPGMKDDPRFWAAGISLVAHMQNPHTPAVHMNTRMFWTPHAWWFGGGADLNPCIEYEEDTAHFHGEMKDACDPHGDTLYTELKKWADEYFYIPHRHRARGVGGIFFDDRNTGDWAADFQLTKDVGSAFLPAYVPLVDKRRVMDWNDTDKETQLQHRGLYAEYNLVYDRGTKFGLETGHDANAVLMSLPPVAKWY
ncbi:MAG: oxygen-dependent coproporphyrinogen oxidase [Amylibacter sp.]|jgi:coproporphyrinogen III oxidase|nr:oxygen-dependent coproporphyrinogen oxidase [Amylibacter sp.]